MWCPLPPTVGRDEAVTDDVGGLAVGEDLQQPQERLQLSEPRPVGAVAGEATRAEVLVVAQSLW